jgi:hypothetical protein
MLYKCDSSNYVFSDIYTNRVFQALEEKRDIGKVGVKIIETANRGFRIMTRRDF